MRTFIEEIEKWNSDKGDETHRLKYNLDSNSIVFDVGSYKGDFAAKISNLYHCHIFCFDPIKEFCDQTRNRDIEKTKVYNFGLGAYTRKQDIFLKDNGTSVFNYSEINSKESIIIQDVYDFVKKENIGCIDLMKINIEGGEYELLDKIIDTGLINIINNVQVQFHSFVDNSIERKRLISQRISKTHKLTYKYEFVWENWEII